MAIDKADLLYRKVYNEVLEDIKVGRLTAGDRLPSTRKMAQAKGVSRLTVMNAYHALEADGVVLTRARSGIFVTPHPLAFNRTNIIPWRNSPQLDWEAEISSGTNRARDHMLSQVLASFGNEDAIPFSWGAGDPALFPVDEFRVIINRVLRRNGTVAMGAEHTEGNQGLRRALAQYLQHLGIPIDKHALLVTTGSQQAISLVADALVKPGDYVVLENPTWPGALEAFSMRGAQLIPMPIDRHGMQIDGLQEILETKQPRLIYTVPTFHNPTGAVMSLERRKRLVSLAKEYGVPILEDDALREVRFGLPLPRPLASLDTSGNVINIGSFTKALIPAARIGYLVGPQSLREAIVARKHWADMFCSPLLQIALSEYLESGQAVRFWKRSNRIYAARQRAILDALNRHFTGMASWNPVGGGPQMWVRVPDSVSVNRLFSAAVQAGVPFAPGEAFFAEPDDQPYLRLNFAAVNEAQINHGIEILGKLLRSEMPSEETESRKNIVRIKDGS